MQINMNLTSLIQIGIIENLPTYISLIFSLTALLTIFMFYKATHDSRKGLIIVVGWFLFQAIVGLSGFYTVITDSIPPRILLQFGIPLLLTIAMFVTQKGQQFIDQLDAKNLLLLHTVRVPVEIVLYWLFINQVIPEIMTFTGRNFDILAGLTAPLIYYAAYIKSWIGKRGLLVWNFFSLALLLNIVSIGLLSAPLPFQQFGFEQPNIALTYFPFVWLASGIVPLVLFSHLASIRQLLIKREN